MEQQEESFLKPNSVKCFPPFSRVLFVEQKIGHLYKLFPQVIGVTPFWLGIITMLFGISSCERRLEGNGTRPQALPMTPSV